MDLKKVWHVNQCGRTNFPHLVNTFYSAAFPSDLSKIEEHLFCRTFEGMNQQFVRTSILLKLIRQLEIDAFIETGTNIGQTSLLIAAQTDLPVYSCELDRSMYDHSRRRLSIYGERIRVDNLDSARFLTSNAHILKHKLPFFYLDAHGDQNEWYQDCPLLSELAIVLKTCKDFVIVIDDFRVPGEDRLWFLAHDSRYLDWNYVKETVRTQRPDLAVFYPSHRASLETGSQKGWVLLAPVLLSAKIKEIIPSNLLSQISPELL